MKQRYRGVQSCTQFLTLACPHRAENGVTMSFKKIIKSAVSLMLAILLCLPATLSVCAAAPCLTITGPDSAKPGETFSVTVGLSNNPGIATYRIKVEFDTSKLLLTDVEAVGKMASKAVTFNTQEGGAITNYTEVVAFYSTASNFKTEGDYFKLTFRAASSASAGSAAITATMIESYNQQFSDVIFASGGKVVNIAKTGDNTPTPDNDKTIQLKKNADKIKYIKGYSDGTFRPNQAATRYEVVEALFKVFDINVIPEDSGLTDVASKYKTYVDYFTTAGIIDGFPDGTFGGSQSITRAQFCKIIAVMMDLNIDNPKNSGFKDVSGWAKRYIDACAAAGLVKGKDEAKKLFDPNANITRAELATLVNRITGALDSGTSCKYSDVIKGKWYYGWVAAAAE